MKAYPILLVLLLLTSCSLQGDQSGTDIPDVNYQTGHDGLTVSFLEDMPPAEVMEGTTFRLGLLYKNEGGYDIDEGFVRVMTGSPFSFVSETITKDIAVEGKTRINPAGGQGTWMLDMKADNIPSSQFNRIEGGVSAFVCYKYTTNFLKAVCLDTDPNGLKKSEKACSVQDLDGGDGQGAPVGISRVDVSMQAYSETALKPSFRIYVENYGDGTVTAPTSYRTLCQSDSSPDVAGVIDYAVNLGSQRLTCEPKKFRLREGEENYLTCSLESGIPSDEPTHVEMLDVALNYGYMYSLSRQIGVVKEAT